MHIHNITSLRGHGTTFKIGYLFCGIPFIILNAQESFKYNIYSSTVTALDNFDICKRRVRSICSCRYKTADLAKLYKI